MAENQLVAEAGQIDDLDEFDGMAIRDIALAVVHWPEGSEDQIRAIAAIRARAPGIGHNRPPLSEALDDELTPHRAKASELVDVAKTAVIVDDESAGKVTNLIAMLGTLERDLDAARLKRTRPYLEAQRLINDRYGELTRLLSTVRQGENGRGGLRGALTAYADRREQEAEAERQRLRAEAEAREKAAAAAREAAEKVGGKVSAELTALREQDEAERLTRRAEAIRPEPIRTHLGAVNRRREIRFSVDNLRLLLGWIIKQPGLKNSIEQAARTTIGQHLKAIGVDGVERGVAIPGLTVSVEKGAANVRR